MEVVKGFFDYCVGEDCVKNEYEKTIKTLYGFGYRTIAINQIVNDEKIEPKKKKKKGEPRGEVDCVPPPIQLREVKGCEDMKLLNRLTIVFTNQDVLHKIIKSPHYKKYHIVAVLPTSQQAFQFTCSNIEADIFSFDSEGRPSYRINRKSYNQLVEKGFHYEILYSPAIVDVGHRRNAIQTSHSYHAYGKSKNIIVSSGAAKSHLIRSPYDIINLGLLFGLNEEQSKNAITHCGRNVFINSVGRRHGKAVMLVQNIVESEEESKMEQDDSGEDDDGEMDSNQPAQKKIKS